MLACRLGAASMRVSDIIARRYELRAALGGGGLGLVFRAFDDKELREVAVKVLDPARCPADAVRRHDSLALAAARARHPAIAAQRVQAAADGAPPLVVGELEEGEDLDALRARASPLPWQRACEIVGTCAEALAVLATATGAAHRALKPGNIRVRADGAVRLLDFGVAELGVQAVPARGELYVEYRAPEQLEGAPGDVRSDVFTLGVLLFELVTGVHPFSGASTFKVMHKVLLQPAPRPSELDPPRAVPATLEALLARALARRPADRFADAAEMGRVLALVRRASAAELAPAVARRPVVAAVDDGPDSTATSMAVAEEPSTILRGLPGVEPPAATPAVKPAAVAPAVAVAPAAAPEVAVVAPPRAAPRLELARAPAPISTAPADPPLLAAVDSTEVVPLDESRRRAAPVAAAVDEDPSTVVVRMGDAPAGERTEILAGISAGAEDSQAMVETTVALGHRSVAEAGPGDSQGMSGATLAREQQSDTTLLLEATRGVVVRGAATASARPELATRALPGERRPARQRRESGSMTNLVVLNVVLVLLAAAGVAWVMLS